MSGSMGRIAFWSVADREVSLRDRTVHPCGGRPTSAWARSSAPGRLMSMDNEIERGAAHGRRAFLGQLAVGAAAGAGVLALSGVANAMPASAESNAAPDADHWLDGLKGKHRQLVD